MFAVNSPIAQLSTDRVSKMNHTLKNQRALITGGSRGIRAAIKSSVWPVKALMLPLIIPIRPIAQFSTDVALSFRSHLPESAHHFQNCWA
jgi:hypothetical protein